MDDETFKKAALAIGAACLVFLCALVFLPREITYSAQTGVSLPQGYFSSTELLFTNVSNDSAYTTKAFSADGYLEYVFINATSIDNVSRYFGRGQNVTVNVTTEYNKTILSATDVNSTAIYVNNSLGGYLVHEQVRVSVTNNSWGVNVSKTNGTKVSVVFVWRTQN